MVDFVNPYTFVGHVREPVRRRPAGHHCLGAGRLSGRLGLTIRARTPLLVGGFEAAGADGEPAHALPRRVDGVVMLPGSGLHGAIRSVHEALAGGCLRVLDVDHVPVHRHPAQPGSTSGLRLAVVTAVDGKGLPTRVVLCGREIGIDMELLAGHPAGPLRTGDRLSLPEGKFERPEKGKRHQLRRRREGEGGGMLGVDPGEIARGGGLTGGADGSWVLLMTDTRARVEERNVWFVAGRVDGEDVSVSGGARDVLAKCLEGADDLRPANQPPQETEREADQARDAGPGGDGQRPTFADVLWPPPKDAQSTGRVVGQRLRVARRLYVGQPVWVRLTGAEVSEVRLSQLWRTPGAGSVGERAGLARPCTNPDDLCPSCRIFGSAGADDRDDEEAARQFSYRGHVRIEDAEATGEVVGRQWELAPLASPRPSAGQFYLDHSDVPPSLRRAPNTEAPAATWGSLADSYAPGPRPIRGRKFYWRTESPTTEPARGHKRDHHRGKQTRWVELIPAETTFVTSLAFDNLSPAQLGSVVAAVDPRRLWPDVDVVTSVGGGKPFGFGSVTVDVTVERMDTAAGRYLGEADPVPTLAECVAAFRVRRPDDPDAVGREALTRWDELRNALTLGYVKDEAVWYPPGDGGPRGSEAYDQGFEFWKKSAGIEAEGERRELVSPPSPADPAEQQVLRLRVTRVPPADRPSDGQRGRGGPAVPGGRAGR